MRVIPPIEITPDMLVSSTCAEPHSTETVYNGATTYASGDRVISVTTHRTYESLVDGNIGNALTSLTHWADVGPTLRYAMFDLSRNSGTTDDAPLTVVFTPGQRIDSIALTGLSAETVTVTVTVDGNDVYTKTINLISRDVTSWYDYFFSPFRFQQTVSLYDLPPFTGATITVTLARTGGGGVSCVAVVVGRSVYMGGVERQAESDAINYSVIERNAFGDTLLIPRRNIPKATLTVWTPKDSINRMLRLRDELNAVPALWQGLEDDEHGYFEAVQILGVYRRFTISLVENDWAKILLDIEEV